VIVTVDSAARRIEVDGEWLPCLIGRAGVISAADKREGDGTTPLGAWPVRGALLRPDRRIAPPARLPWRWLRPDDGWSDDVHDPAYNRPVRHPHPFSAERLWREDGVYDAILWLGHNEPPVAGAGSAIFLHLTGDKDFTEGCVAVSRDAMMALLSSLATGDALAIR
jgi:L,D-peptidoglycan transpeptidase YkuD (ErfK/YbiS/YcfS/YnhG family)